MSLVVKGDGYIQPLYQGNKPFLTDKREHIALVKQQRDFKAITLLAGQVIHSQLNIQTPNSTLSRVLAKIRSGQSICTFVRGGNLFFVPGGLSGGHRLMQFVDAFASYIASTPNIETMTDLEKKDWQSNLVNTLYRYIPERNYAGFY